MPRSSPTTSAAEYRRRAAHELAAVGREIKTRGYPAPSGNPLSGVVLLISGPIGPRLLNALTLSLERVGLRNAYATYARTSLFERELLLCEPYLLAAVGREAASEIDDLRHPLASGTFSKATEGVPFAYKRNTTGLLIPDLASALDDETRKRRFWHAFLNLKTVAQRAENTEISLRRRYGS